MAIVMPHWSIRFVGAAVDGVMDWVGQVAESRHHLRHHAHGITSSV
jgi:hypothetical protein